MPLEPGQTATVERVVTPELTADGAGEQEVGHFSGEALSSVPYARVYFEDVQPDIERWAENQRGEKVVTGRATVTPPSRG
ncbi:MAG TPA: hypothetical protein VIG07_16695 [Methylomirabilota bacterium]|jgi:hypothetical protein